MIASWSGEMKGVVDYLKWDHSGQGRKKRLFALKGSEERQISEEEIGPDGTCLMQGCN